MKIKLALSFLISMLLIVSISSSGININSSFEKQNEFKTSYTGSNIELPIWDVGDEWTYRIEAEGNQGNAVDFDITINNFIVKVTEVLSDSYKLYVEVPRGDFRGGGSVDLDIITISGNLKDTRLTGYMYIKKSNLAFMNIDVTIDGKIDKIVDIPFDVDMQVSFYNEQFNQTNFSYIDFPFDEDDNWIVPGAYIISELDVNLLPEPVEMYNYVEEHIFTSSGWENIQGFYSAKILRNNQNDDVIYYSPAAGGISKIEYNSIDLGYGYNLNNFEMTLKSTTYEAPTNSPNAPSTPSGENSLDVGSKASYTTSASDPDSDPVRYIFDWGDGKTTQTDFYNSGESVTLDHTWSKDGIFNLKVKAVDIYGAESSWSNPLSVEVLNEAPEKPATPDGPSEGKIKRSYEYSSISNDSEGHKIRYGWDWDGDKNVDQWTDYKNSGVEVSTSHKYTTQGDYQIFVIAEDEYGSQSEWSDPLSVVMPKNRFLDLDFIQNILSSFNFLREIFNVFL